ncbi:MAG: SH3 domain-containing protein [Hyphomonas sp.]
MRLRWVILGVLSACLSAPASLADPVEVVTRISQFSGKQVPRFEMLKYSAVNGRTGPSRDHAVQWRYERQGLPVMIIKESANWRRVRDPSGAEVWMHARMLTAGDDVMLQADTMLKAKPDEAAKDVAFFGEGVLADLGQCQADWCQVSAKGLTGWARRSALWGADISEAGL